MRLPRPALIDHDGLDSPPGEQLVGSRAGEFFGSNATHGRQAEPGFQEIRLMTKPDITSVNVGRSTVQQDLASDS